MTPQDTRIALVDRIKTRKYYLRTPYGDQYYIHENGNIERADGQNAPSNQWRMLGLQHVRRNEFIPFSMLDSRLANNGLELAFKNGKPQWTVRDIDHGTTREWGNTEHHGVRFFHHLAG